jgi:hypothetical protein
MSQESEDPLVGAIRSAVRGDALSDDGIRGTKNYIIVYISIEICQELNVMIIYGFLLPLMSHACERNKICLPPPHDGAGSIAAMAGDCGGDTYVPY